MARSQGTKKVTRIQREKIDTILEAALDVFSSHGFRGSTLDMVAKAADISKPNLLYYFDNKHAMHRQLLDGLLETWLDPLKEISEAGDPVEEILRYVERKLEISRESPRESRLFANEILQGAPNLLDELKGPLKKLVDEKASIVKKWADEGKILPVDPYQFVFSIWATTQHYADFDIQIRAVEAEQTREEHWASARSHLNAMFSRLLSPQ